ncbi:methane monooxygenase/ammonia monooxygenase subunit A [Candidatus Nitrosacidococcus sp. I8]|uniref:methane monooxygenase/ammonia monooxygenase subunit A n=1 Tax=Candidatus Nitrosacidococcus sp. I8 TaxID=2942908 RepID=UPI002226D702|nr:methane monooxygenase/ammonia monooxygenase subunit A [Candidatus Nitrosacidococcus sp. I8]CAH9019088.1 Particulate methane monooxygenase beta subunit [Candidatus Nitrosacidococcus sp. I8]
MATGRVGTGAGSAVYSPEEAAKVSRTMDILALGAFFFIFLASFHVHYMLLAGDWDFWLDWKDRRFWVTIAPIVAVCYPAAMQAFMWEKFRLPFGATFVTLGLILAEWINRYFNFHLFTYFPVHFVQPTVLLPMALILDASLALAKSFVLAAVVGGMSYGLLMYPANWPIIGQFHEPVDVNGLVMSVADVMGFHYVRTGNPEYIRMVEKGTLRSFGEDVVPVSAFFSGFVSICMYFGWYMAGRWFSRSYYTESI